MQEKETLLHISSFAGHAHVVKLLIDAAANVNARNMVSYIYI